MNKVLESWFFALFALALGLQSTAAFGQNKPAIVPNQMDTILYGAAYYPEYMPYDRLEEDAKLMQQAGINVVRVGEFSWGLWEPEDGRFEFAWMDRVVDRMQKAGINVIMGTPTASIPAWLYKAHPEIIITKADGSKMYFGMRQNTDLLNPTYRFYSERVTRVIVEHYRNNPAVIGYQLDNETGSYDPVNPDVQAAFLNYLQAKFKTVEQLDEIWGLNYWGQRLYRWTDLPGREGIINPGWKLEWQRFQQWITTDFLNWQAEIVKEYKGPTQFITHDLAAPPRPRVNEEEISQSLDIVAANIYEDRQDVYDGAKSSLQGDFARSLKHTNFLLTETNAQSDSANSIGQYPPFDGQIRLAAYTHISSGANMVEYWHWHSLHYGLETYVKGVLGHDLEPGRVYDEVSRTAHELQRVGPEIVDTQRPNKVAILYSDDSHYGIDYMPFSDHENYRSILTQMYNALYKLNVGVDFVLPDSMNFSDYKMIVVPPLYIASDDLLNRLSEYVRQGGNVVMAFKSGFCNEYSTVRWTMAPGPLRKAAGFRYQEFTSLRQPLALKGDPFQAGAQNKVSDWAEMLIPETAKGLAYYDTPFLARYPAVTRNQYGAGTLTYEGTVLSAQLQQKVMLDALKLVGLDGPDQQLPPPVRVKHGVNRNGKRLHYYLNYSPDAQKFVYPYGAGRDLLAQTPVAHAQTVALQPWDVAIIEEK
jgi:beta-galactosidase